MNHKKRGKEKDFKIIDAEEAIQFKETKKYYSIKLKNGNMKSIQRYQGFSSRKRKLKIIK